MSTFKDKLAAAKASRPFKDQHVILDSGISEEVAGLEAELGSIDETDNRLGVSSRADEIRARIDELTAEGFESGDVIRVFRMPGRDWVKLTVENPPRADVAIDTLYGYNFDAVCEAALLFRDPKTDASYAFRLEDGKTVEISPDEWDDLFSILSGREFALLRDAVYELNEYDPQQRLNELVKHSGAATRSAKK